MAAPLGRRCLQLLDAIQIDGVQHLVSAKPVIFAANHISELDGPVICAGVSLRKHLLPLFFVAQSWNLYSADRFGWRRHFYVPWLLGACGARPFVQGKQNYAVALERHVALLRLGYSLLIFPEGEIRTLGQRPPAHGGVAYLCDAARVPVVPIHIAGTDRASWPDLRHGNGCIRLAFGKPLTRDELLPPSAHQCGPAEYKAAAARIMDAVARLVATT